jgi:predicted porin
MQRKLLGVAVAAALAAPAVALAQSAVQIYGTVHMSANSAKFTSDNIGNQEVTKFGVTQHASNWGLRSTETLGGGMTAWLQAEFNMVMNRENYGPNGPGSARNSGLGLRGNFGNIYVGTWETPWAQTFRLWDVGTIGGWGPTTSIIGRRETTNSGRLWNCTNIPSSSGGSAGTLPTGALCGTSADGPTSFGTAAASANLGYPLWRRFGRSIFYESPLFAGVQFKVAIQPNQGKSALNSTTGVTGQQVGAITTVGVNANPSAWSSSLTWTGLGGRARAFAANMQAKDWTTVGQTDSGYTFGGGYDFGVVNLGATYEKYTYKGGSATDVSSFSVADRNNGIGDVTAKEWAVGAAIPLGPGKIGLSYAKAKPLEGGISGIVTPAVGNNGAFSNDTGAKMFNMGYEWALSKRTQLGFGIAKITNGNNVGFTWTGQLVNANGVTAGGASVNPGVSQTNTFVSMRHSF